MEQHIFTHLIITHIDVDQEGALINEGHMILISEGHMSWVNEGHVSSRDASLSRTVSHLSLVVGSLGLLVLDLIIR